MSELLRSEEIGETPHGRWLSVVVRDAQEIVNTSDKESVWRIRRFSGGTQSRFIESPRRGFVSNLKGRTMSRPLRQTAPYPVQLISGVTMAFSYKSAVAAILLLASASAAIGEDDPIKARQAVMKATGAAMGALVKMNKGETPFDAAAAKEALETIATKPKGFDALFPAGSDKGDTAAKSTIWTDTAGFKAALDKLLTTASAEAAKPPADLKGVNGAIKAIGETCGNCHETYRVKKS